MNIVKIEKRKVEIFCRNTSVVQNTNQAVVFISLLRLIFSKLLFSWVGNTHDLFT